MRSQRVKVLTKRMVAMRDITRLPADAAFALHYDGRLFGYHPYSRAVLKAEREALLRIPGQEFGHK